MKAETNRRDSTGQATNPQSGVVHLQYEGSAPVDEAPRLTEALKTAVPDPEVENTPTMERNATMTDKIKNPASDIFDQALKNYEQALRTGLKVQEEAGRCWTKLLNQAASPQDLQKQITTMANEVIPATQKSMEGCLDLLEQNSRTSVDLLKKGLEASQTTNFGDSQGKLIEFCESSLKALKANAQALVDINSKVIDSWIGVVRKATADVGELKAEKA